MDYGTVVGISGNGVETVTAEQILFTAQFLQFTADAKLCLSSGLYRWCEPFQEFHHGHAVAQHGAAVAFHLCRMFYGFEQAHGGCSVYYGTCFGQAAAEGVVGGLAVCPYPLAVKT